jgi:hypothetical protein
MRCRKVAPHTNPTDIVEVSSERRSSIKKRKGKKVKPDPWVVLQGEPRRRIRFRNRVGTKAFSEHHHTKQWYTLSSSPLAAIGNEND